MSFSFDPTAELRLATMAFLEVSMVIFGPCSLLYGTTLGDIPYLGVVSGTGGVHLSVEPEEQGRGKKATHLGEEWEVIDHSDGTVLSVGNTPSAAMRRATEILRQRK